MHSLPLFHRLQNQPVLVLGTGAAAEAKRNLVERAGGNIIADLDQAIAHKVRLAFIAIEDRDYAQGQAVLARKAGMLVNVVDQPDLCDFTTPSILDRDPVLLAVGTGGASAGLAKHIRLRLEAILPGSLGVLAKKLRHSRAALRQKFPDMVKRRGALDFALEEGGTLDPFDEGAASRVEQWLNQTDQTSHNRSMEIVLSSTDPDDLTLRQARFLGRADAVVFDDDVPDAILNRARADAQRIPLGQSNPAPPGQVAIIRRG